MFQLLETGEDIPFLSGIKSLFKITVSGDRQTVQ